MTNTSNLDAFAAALPGGGGDRIYTGRCVQEPLTATPTLTLALTLTLTLTLALTLALPHTLTLALTHTLALALLRWATPPARGAV